LIRALVGKDVILKAPHQIERYLQVLEPEGTHAVHPPPLMRVGDDDRKQADEILRACPPGVPLVGMVPGSRHPIKRWPAVHQASLADRCRQAGLGVLILGGRDDVSQARAVTDNMKSRADLVQTGGSLGLLAGLLSRCAVVVSPDSGPAHMAAALGVPVVTLFGPTSHERWAPQGRGCRVERVDLPCSPCSNHGGSSCPLGTLDCMRAISPQSVWQTVCDLLEQRP
jgi:ADP-heptose:LPS heptosyltransferase